MPINWKTQDSQTKLVAALVASLEQKSLDYKKIAMYFGEGATYNSVEGQFRSIRAAAKELKDSASASGVSAPAEPKKKKAKTESKPSSGRGGIAKGRTTQQTSTSNALNSTLAGRVSKSKSKSVTPGDKTGENALAAAKELDEFEYGASGFAASFDGAADIWEDQFGTLGAFGEGFYSSLDNTF